MSESKSKISIIASSLIPFIIITGLVLFNLNIFDESEGSSSETGDTNQVVLYIIITFVVISVIGAVFTIIATRKQLSSQTSEKQIDKSKESIEYYCSSCGYQLTLSDEVCPSCGNSTEDEKKVL